MKPRLDEMFVLRNNQRVHLRPIQPEDAALLKRLHSRLSTDSVYHRFFGTLKELPDDKAAAFARVDFEERVAIIAESGERGSQEILGVARYSLDQSGEDLAAEIAIVVEDRYQNQGLGSQLLRRLIEIAHHQGIRLLKATVQPDNQQILGLIDRSPLPTERTFEGGVWDIELHLPDDLETTLIS